MRNLYIQHTFAACQKFFGIDGWYKYIPKVDNCQLDFSKYGLGNIWLIVAGVTDILLRLGVFVAIIFFIIGAFKLITSQGSPEGVKSARGTMTNSLVGMVLLMIGSWLIGFMISFLFK